MQGSKERGLGYGFGVGMERVVIQNESWPKSIALTEASLAAIAAGKIEQLSPLELAAIIPDIFADRDIGDLANTLPSMVDALSRKSKNIIHDFFSKGGELDPQMMRELARINPNKIPWAEQCAPNNLDKMNPRVMAYILPAVLRNLEFNEQQVIAAELASLIPMPWFKIYLEPDYFIPKVGGTKAATLKATKENGRTVQIFAAADNDVTMTFRGREWKLNHTHIHPGHVPVGEAEREREFKIYASRRQYVEGKSAPDSDPNNKVIAEWHTVFASGSEPASKRYAVLGTQIALGAHNESFQQFLNQAVTYINGSGAAGASWNHTKIFTDWLAKHSPQELAFDSFSSLRVNADKDAPLANGVHFAFLPQPIRISAEQYAHLHSILPEIKPLDPNLQLAPIGKRGGIFEEKNLPQKVTIIGGGLAAISIALQLGMLKRPNGTPYFHVTLVESKDKLYAGASKVAAQGHLGQEYAFAGDDGATSLACLLGSIHARQILDAGRFQTNETCMTFALAEGSRHLPAGAPESERLSEKETRAHFLQNYELISKEYAEYFLLLAKEYGPAKAAEMFFGWPDELYSILARNEFESSAPTASVAIETKEYGFNMMRLGHHLVEQLELMAAKQGNITIMTSHEVTKAEKDKNGKFQLTCANGVSIKSDLVVNTSFQNFFTLDHQIAPEATNDIEAHVYARGMVYLDISKVSPEQLSIFMLLGEKGGMFKRLDGETAYLYLPGKEIEGHQGAYLGEAVLNKDNPNLPADIIAKLNMGKEERLKIAEGILEVQRQRFPLLKDAKVIDLMVAPTVTLVHGKNKGPDVLERRPREEIMQPTDGWFSSLLTKATYFATMSVDTARHAVASLVNKGHPLPKNFELPLTGDLPVVLPRSVSLEQGAANFAGNHGYKNNFVISSKPSHRRSVPTWSSQVRPADKSLYTLPQMERLDAIGRQLETAAIEVSRLLKHPDIKGRKLDQRDVPKLSKALNYPFSETLLRIHIAMKQIEEIVSKDAGSGNNIHRAANLKRLQSEINQAAHSTGLDFVTSFSLTNRGLVLTSSKELGVTPASMLKAHRLEVGGYTLVLSKRGYATPIRNKPGQLFVDPNLTTGSTSGYHIFGYAMGIILETVLDNVPSYNPYQLQFLCGL